MSYCGDDKNMKWWIFNRGHYTLQGDLGTSFTTYVAVDSLFWNVVVNIDICDFHKSQMSYDSINTAGMANKT